MLRKPLSETPSHCSLCELRNDACDICPSTKAHCMKYHVQIIPFIRPCEWRATAKAGDIKEALEFANNQLSEYYAMRHDAKQRNTRLRRDTKHRNRPRGMTKRLTITPDFFRD